ncbi:Regulatory protein cro [Escherichia coli]|nr:Regulatory protein cro [Escherichia coli]
MEQRITLKDYAMRFGQTKTAKISAYIKARSTRPFMQAERFF